MNGANLVLGKQPHPYFRPGQSMFFDGDYNPEGGAVTYKLSAGDIDFFTNLGGFWVVENGKDSSIDTGLFGAQGGAKANLMSKKAYLLAGAGYFEYTNPRGKTMFYGAPRGNTAVANAYVYDYDELEAFAEAGAVIGGIDLTNELSWLVLSTMAQIHLSEPAVYVRYHENQDENFILHALECNREFGGGNPAFLNDEMGTQRYLDRGVPIEDACNWNASGCLGYHLECCEHMAGALNLVQTKVFEVTLHDGLDPRTGLQVGLHTGDVRNMTLEQIYEAFLKQEDYFADRMRDHYFVWSTTENANSPMSGYRAGMRYRDCSPADSTAREGGCRDPGGKVAERVVVAIQELLRAWIVLRDGKTGRDDRFDTRLSEAVDRPVRFVGRPDVAPIGPLLRRIGGLLDHPDEVAGALCRGGSLRGALPRSGSVGAHRRGHPPGPRPAARRALPVARADQLRQAGA